MKKTTFNPFCKSDNVANKDENKLVQVSHGNSNKMWLFGRKSKVKPHEIKEIKEIQHNVKLVDQFVPEQPEYEIKQYYYNDNANSHG